MRKRLIDVFRMLLPLGLQKRRLLALMAPHVTKQELSDLRYLLKLRRVGLHEERFNTKAFADVAWPQATPAVEDQAVLALATMVNWKVQDAVVLAHLRDQKGVALDTIASLVAPNLLGLDDAKRAAALQLFAQEPVHILLLGDPGTGKTEILRGAERLAPHAVFGLGSGASKVGLTGMYEGQEFRPGLLVQADEGLALIDELNLLRKEDQAGLYSAMEKGLVTYDKKGKHERHDARIRVLATANPKGDRFVGKDAKFLRSQLPFDDALLSRFHLVFLIRKPDERRMEAITRKIVKDEMRELEDGDAAFVKEYVRYAEKLNVRFDDAHESMVVSFMEDLKREERNLIVETGPRTVIGVIRLAKAHARARLSRNTNADDVEAAMRLMKAALLPER